MITVLVSVVAGMITDSDTGWVVFWSLLAFQLITGQL